MTRRDRLIALTRHVIRIDSQNPPGREAALARFVAADLREAGLTVRTYSFRPGRTNVVAVLPGRERRRPGILLTPHLDTVPVGRGWRRDPLGGEVRGGRIYGRGASDDKGNLACCMEVVRRLAEDGFRPARDIVLAATADEETGSHLGLIPLLERKILRPAAAVVMDSDEGDVIVAQKGLIHARVRIEGRKAHAAYRHLGINAVETAARVIVRLERLKLPHRRHPLLGPPTTNIGVIHGGDKVNMVPDLCEFALDVRFLPGMRAREVLKEVRSVIREETRRFHIEIDDVQPPYDLGKDHPLVRAYAASARRCGMPCRIKGSEGATVITFFQKQGIPAIATGVAAEGTAHTTDEYVRIATLCRGADALEDFLRRGDYGETSS